MIIHYKLQLGDGWSYGEGYVLPDGATEMDAESWAAEVDAARAPPLVDLADLKSSLLTQIDAAAERERARYITAGSGQAMEYQQAAAEAEQLRAALSVDPEHEPDPADYPMLAASLGIDGATLAEVASTVAAMHEAWRIAGSAIRAIRLAAKAAVAAAEDEAAARAAADVIWPGEEG